MINLRAYAKWTWGTAELAAHEMAKVADFIEELIAGRPVVLDLMNLSPDVRVCVGGLELAAHEVEKVKAFVAQLKAPPAAPPGENAG
jgi:SepF-like predicted cell division protein (DUF552 family)